MAVNEGQIARDALSEWTQECFTTLREFAKTYPEVFRRGVNGLLEPPVKGRDATKARSLLQALANEDPAGYDAEIGQRIQATSFQEVAELVSGGRLQRQGG